MKRTDVEFHNNQLRIMSLDVDEKLPRRKWIELNRDKSSWIIAEIPGVDFESFAGSGANGIVLKAKEHISHRTCAVKIWLPHKYSNYYNVYFEKYQEEVQKISSLKDPAIIMIYSANINSKGYYYSIMEWVNGVTLKQFLANEKNLRHQTRFELLDTVLSSITKCHKKNIFHGDLHQENILIEKTGEYKSQYNARLLDFETSLLNRGNKPEYNKQRESALLLETALKLLDEEKRYKILEFKFYSSSNTKRVKVNNINDVRNFHPLLVSTTLKNLNEIYYIVESNPMNNTVISDALDLLINTTGIDLDNFFSYLLSKVKGGDEEFHRNLSAIFMGKIHDHLFEVPMFSHREYELMVCYYELLKIPSPNKEIKETFQKFDEETFDYNEILYLNSLETVLNWIYNAKALLTEKQFSVLSHNLFVFLGKKFDQEYKSENKFTKLYDLATKLNELKLISAELPLIVKCITE